MEGVRRILAEHIVSVLSFRGERPAPPIDVNNKFRQRAWRSALRWLDDSGLAFYFLQKLKDTNATDTVPAWIVSRLECNFAANRGRAGKLQPTSDGVSGVAC